VLAWLSVWSEVQICIWPSWCHCHSLSLASVKCRLVLPFWYRLTWVVPGKGPLDGCVCVCLAFVLQQKSWLFNCIVKCALWLYLRYRSRRYRTYRLRCYNLICTVWRFLFVCIFFCVVFVLETTLLIKLWPYQLWKRRWCASDFYRHIIRRYKLFSVSKLLYMSQNWQEFEVNVLSTKMLN